MTRNTCDTPKGKIPYWEARIPMFVDQVFISWIGPTSFGVERNGVTKAFSLEEGQAVPSEFKKGDFVELYLEGDPEAEIWGIEKSDGCYTFKHIPSGKEFKTWHRAEAWRFDPSPTSTVQSEEERLARVELKLLKEYLEESQGNGGDIELTQVHAEGLIRILSGLIEKVYPQAQK